MKTPLRIKKRAPLGIEKSCGENPKLRRWLNRELATTRTLVSIRAELKPRFGITLSLTGLSKYVSRHEAKIYASRRRGAAIGEQVYQLIIKAPGARFIAVRLVPVLADPAPETKPPAKRRNRKSIW